MKSLSARVLLSAGLVLIVFVILTSLSVRHAVHTRAEQALHDRLQGLIYGILGAAELDESGTLKINAHELPDQALNSPGTGLYAEISGNGHIPVWQSKSSVVNVPPIQPIATGEWHFGKSGDTPETGVRYLQFAFSWSEPPAPEQRFHIQVVDDDAAFRAQLAGFDKTLIGTLALSALALLATLLMALHISLRPVRQIGLDVRALERQQTDRLDTDVPTELQPLVNNINALLDTERNRQQRYRRVMDDLAHNLKTPLSIVHNLAQQSDSGPQNPALLQQSARMQEIIDHHLQRAYSASPAVVNSPRPLAPALHRLADTLKQVYADKAPVFDLIGIGDTAVRVADGDLLEIFGNLLENSCKYGAGRIIVQAHTEDGMANILLRDDGPGFPPEAIDRLIERGQRADTSIEGHGLGLAASVERTQSVGGSLSISNADSGGARVMLKLPV